MIDVELHGGPHDGRRHNAVALDAVLRVPTVERNADESMPDVTYAAYQHLGRYARDGVPIFDHTRE
ncbi:hypothetical protein JVX90_00370 [Gordonia sp. PDNC005]|uniref:hypothetical protein n=1 Tax=Gordonia sp. PDNC005 TaxID=2811424 RepID=UPI001965330F|nr:hypothetical protein [Gordonia sp. PDNC005]QRY62767.1 hypothetical protein JVX90_00370 [Gordonia sp. PDNC005]